MKTKRLLTILFFSLGLICSCVKIGRAASLGTAFTYQGHLYDANNVANDLYDFQFRLYDSASDGNQIGGDVNVPDVDVIDAYFAVEMDFGLGVFDGNARWLEIGVRQGGLEDPNQYTALVPRQEIKPTPYAQTSIDSDTLDGILGRPSRSFFQRFERNLNRCAGSG